MKAQHGSIGLNIILTLMVVVIGVLIYLLLNGGIQPDTKSYGTDSPQHTDMTPRPNANNGGGFTDGMGRPDSSTEYPLDETGYGISKVDVFNRDINNDGQIDRITRTRYENGTAHFYDEYLIELNNNGFFINITPKGFRTTEGGECALQKLKFIFKPKFTVVKVSRKWVDTWTTPSAVTKTTYELQGRELTPVNTADMGVACDVTDMLIK